MKNISQILQSTDSASFMVSSLSSLVKSLSGGIQRVKFKYRHDDIKSQTCGTKYRHYDCFF